MNTRPEGRVFKCLRRDPANVNAMKQTCDRYSCILPDSSRKLHRKRLQVIKIVAFSTLNLLNRMASACKIECQRRHFRIGLQSRTSKTSSPLPTLTSTKAQTKCSFRASTFCSVTSCKQTSARLGDFQVKNMFKQHVNSMI